MKILFSNLLLGFLLVTFTSVGHSQTRDEKVIGDRESLRRNTDWHYDNLAKGIEVAQNEQKPLMVVLRCIP